MAIDPRHPECDMLWRAIAKAEARSLAVVSANAGEGCSTVAEAIWRRAAWSGRSALLVDLNRDRPALANRLGGAAPGEIQTLGNSGLGLLSEPGEAAMQDWRDPARLREAVAGWLRNWEIVVLDAAPLVARGTQGIPGVAAAAAAEAAVLVVLTGRTPALAVREAGEALHKSGVRLLGTVLNDRDSPLLRDELTRESERLGRVAPGLSARLAGALRRASLLSMRV